MAATKFYVEALRNYLDGSGRASRSEFWYFYLAYVIVAFCGAVVSVVLESTGASIVGTILFLGIIAFHFIPSWTVTVRRLHDTGRSGWWLLIAILPFAGAVVLFVFMVEASVKGSNDYGRPPYTLEQL